MTSIVKKVLTASMLMTLLMMPATLLAQDTTTTKTQGVDVFKMFFFPVPQNPDFLDWLGVYQVVFLVLLSVVAMAFVIQFALKNRKINIVPEETQAQLEQLMNEKRYAEAIQLAQADPSYLGKIASASLSEAPNGFGAMERALEESSDEETTRLLRPLEILNIIANIAPMIGLFGTVYGMIVAFRRLVDAGGKPDPAALAGGISTALVTTFWGLVIAIPVMICYTFIRNNVDMQSTEGVLVVQNLIKPFRPSRNKSASSSATSATAASSAGGAQRPRATPKPPTTPEA